VCIRLLEIDSETEFQGSAAGAVEYPRSQVDTGEIDVYGDLERPALSLGAAQVRASPNRTRSQNRISRS
jgi:hypothetical protein